jgi:hypothetical protein
VFQAPGNDIRLLSFLVRGLSVSRVEPAGMAPPLSAAPVAAPTGEAPRRRRSAAPPAKRQFAPPRQA